MAKNFNKEQDKKWMRIALKLAKKGVGKVSPNPCVGAVVVNQGKVVGKGYHERFGGPHGEVVALKQAGKKAEGATLYVTLEPCATYGKTPPCVQAVLESGVRRVVVGTLDPNPKHQGIGIRQLRLRQVKVEVGAEEEEAKRLIESFRYWILHQKPFVIVKEAMSLDGKIATAKGDSQWISSSLARQWVHGLRSGVDAILVGKKTAIQDNPQLTVRGKSRSLFQPIRIVLTRDGKISKNLKLLSSELKNQTWIAAGSSLSLKTKGKWKKGGVIVLNVRSQKGIVSISDLLKELGKRGITSLLVEGGGETVGKFFDAKAVNKMYLFIAPKIIGGREALTPVEGKGISKMISALPVSSWSWKSIGKDLLIEAYF